MITTAGFYMLSDLWTNSDTPAEFLYIAYGTGTTAANIADTTLETEVDRALATLVQRTTYDTLDTMRFQHLFSEAAAGSSVSEVGVLTAAVGGTLLARTILSPIVTVTANGNLLVTYDFIVKDGGPGGF